MLELNSKINLKCGGKVVEKRVEFQLLNKIKSPKVATLDIKISINKFLRKRKDSFCVVLPQDFYST